MRRSVRSRTPHGTRSGRSGQSLVEFALVLGPLLLILLGIIQFGFIFNTYITVTNAAREAAREGSIYVYDRSLSSGQNDSARNAYVLTTVKSSMNYLATTAPHFTSGSTWTQSGTTFTNGDLTIAYTTPSGVTASDPRTGENLTVTVKYHMDLMIPLIAALLSKDVNGRFIVSGATTMAIN